MSGQAKQIGFLATYFKNLEYYLLFPNEGRRIVNALHPFWPPRFWHRSRRGHSLCSRRKLQSACMRIGQRGLPWMAGKGRWVLMAPEFWWKPTRGWSFCTRELRKGFTSIGGGGGESLSSEGFVAAG